MFDIREQIFRVKEEEIHQKQKENNAFSIPIVLVGNKCDIDDSRRQVTFERGNQAANEWEVPFFEVSALEEIQNEECFFDLAREMKVFVLFFAFC